MKFFTTPSSKNIIAALRIVTIETSELTFLLILYFHGILKLESGENCYVFSSVVLGIFRTTYQSLYLN